MPGVAFCLVGKLRDLAVAYGLTLFPLFSCFLNNKMKALKTDIQGLSLWEPLDKD